VGGLMAGLPTLLEGAFGLSTLEGLASGRSAAVLAERAIPSPMPSATVDIRTDGRKRRE